MDHFNALSFFLFSESNARVAIRMCASKIFLETALEQSGDTWRNKFEIFKFKWHTQKQNDSMMHSIQNFKNQTFIPNLVELIRNYSLIRFLMMFNRIPYHSTWNFLFKYRVLINCDCDVVCIIYTQHERSRTLSTDNRKILRFELENCGKTGGWSEDEMPIIFYFVLLHFFHFWFCFCPFRFLLDFSCFQTNRKMIFVLVCFCYCFPSSITVYCYFKTFFSSFFMLIC